MFAAASILTGLVSSLEWGIATRILTGIAGAGMLPIAFAVAGTFVAVQGAVLLFIAILVLAKPRRAPAEQMP
ncbi:hypothetical protein [Chelativorans sp. YIM 93263]|uniref:hypothetical protein n=1 Tax=Chelativorans sp. YIM 93263 TaxID=2906648 RepID=UPI002378C2EA|nr:hypothetical protein [Chelativorans sp. YIM 93263]